MEEYFTVYLGARREKEREEISEGNHSSIKDVFHCQPQVYFCGLRGSEGPLDDTSRNQGKEEY